MLPPLQSRRTVLCLLYFALYQRRVASSAVPCTEETAEECESLAGNGSFCRTEDGFCSNPFEQGCLYRMLPGWNKKRVCNSDDPEDAEERGICRKPPIDYTELRIWAGNWESINFEAWILQIILSELLDAPTTLETGLDDKKMSFYDPVNSFQYGTSRDSGQAAMDTAFKYGGDCSLRFIDPEDPEKSEYCTHFVSEIWNDLISNDQGKNQLDTGKVEPPQAMGVMGKEGWFVTKFSVEKDPTLVSFYGLQGSDDENRLKLAETFKRPTTWKDYCQLISTSNCTVDDGVAKRPPQDESEYDRMFVEGLFTGYFRSNECDLADLSTCSGHIADYPCGWSSFAESQVSCTTKHPFSTSILLLTLLLLYVGISP